METFNKRLSYFYNKTN